MSKPGIRSQTNTGPLNSFSTTTDEHHQAGYVVERSSRCWWSWPQEAHADLGLVDDDGLVGS